MWWKKTIGSRICWCVNVCAIGETPIGCTICVCVRARTRVRACVPACVQLGSMIGSTICWCVCVCVQSGSTALSTCQGQGTHRPQVKRRSLCVSTPVSNCGCAAESLLHQREPVCLHLTSVGQKPAHHPHHSFSSRCKVLNCPKTHAVLHLHCAVYCMLTSYCQSFPTTSCYLALMCTAHILTPVYCMRTYVLRRSTAAWAPWMP